MLKIFPNYILNLFCKESNICFYINSSYCYQASFYKLCSQSEVKVHHFFSILMSDNRIIMRFNSNLLFKNIKRKFYYLSFQLECLKFNFLNLEFLKHLAYTRDRIHFHQILFYTIFDN